MAKTEASTHRQTPLTHVHKELGARMVLFAGYEMPVQYPDGIVAEHQHTREAAGLFDISHMGQVFLRPGSEAPDKAIERLVPSDIQGLKPGRIRYTVLLNKEGGIIDDLMITRPPEGQPQDHLFLVVNAAIKDVDVAYMREHLADAGGIEHAEDRALLALQGPKAAAVLSRFAPGCEDLRFMSASVMHIDGAEVFVSRCGYTGEDGFELSMPAEAAEPVFRLLLGEAEVRPVGLGARDTLRLEAGMCLYGQDLDAHTTPVEAELAWTIGKRRREAADFPGAAKILEQLEGAPARRRVGLLPAGRAPVRADTAVVDPADGRRIGRVTSGGYGPTVGGPIAMAYIETAYAEPGAEVHAMVRDKARPCRVSRLPFIQRRNR